MRGGEGKEEEEEEDEEDEEAMEEEEVLTIRAIRATALIVPYDRHDDGARWWTMMHGDDEEARC